MMILLCVLISFISLCYGQNAELSYQDECHNVGGTLILEAFYTGTGTPQPMTWTYSGSSLDIDTDTCLPFGGIPPNFPDTSRLSFKCVTTDSLLPANTYQIKVSGLLADELNETWGATFTPPGGIAPGAVQLAIPRNCDDCTCVCKCICRKMVIASIVIGIVGAIILPIAVGGTVKEYFGRMTALLVVSIGSVLGVTSFVLGIVVQVKDCCKASECCEDSDCCKDGCEGNWIEIIAGLFIGIGALVGIVGSVIFYRVWSGRIGPGNNGITKQDLRPWEEIVREKLLHVLESAYPKILSVKDLIRKVDAEESVVNEQLEELRREDLIRQLDSGGFVRHLLDVKTRTIKQDLRPWEEIVREMLLHVLESVYPNILSVKDLIRIDFAEESVVMEQLEELKGKDLIRKLDNGGFVRHLLDVKTRITKQDFRLWEEIVREMLLHVHESVYPNILSVTDLIRIDFAEERVVMEQLEELRRKDLIRQLDCGGFVRYRLDVKTAYKAEEAKEPDENDRLMETSY